MTIELVLLLQAEQEKLKAAIEEHNAVIWKCARKSRKSYNAIAANRKRFLTIEKELFALTGRTVVVLPAFPPVKTVKPPKPVKTEADKLFDQALKCFSKATTEQQEEMIDLYLQQLEDSDETETEENETL